MIRANVKVETSLKSAPGFTFINLSEPVKQSKDKDLRKLVRSNAMRAYRQAAKQTAVKAPSRTNESDEGCEQEGSSFVGDEELYEQGIEQRQESGQNCSHALELGGLLSLSHSIGVRCARADCDRCRTGHAGNQLTTDPQMYIGDCITDPFNIFPGFGRASQYFSEALDHCKPPPSLPGSLPEATSQ